MRKITLITGGEKSGKSSYALRLTEPYNRKAFIATAEAFDDEMRERIASHRKERDASFQTIEEPIDLAGALRAIPAPVEVAVIDCLTVWLGNLLHRHGIVKAEYEEVSDFIKTIKKPGCDLIIVTNEVGMGIIPQNDMARRFRYLSGLLNQEVGRQACRAVLMVSGLPLSLKGE